MRKRGPNGDRDAVLKELFRPVDNKLENQICNIVLPESMDNTVSHSGTWNQHLVTNRRVAIRMVGVKRTVDFVSKNNKERVGSLLRSC